MQTYPNIELIFVIERSEKLLEEIKVYSGSIKLFNTKYIFSKDKLGLAKARNTGIHAATGELLAFTDDDAIPFANWAEEIVNAFSKYREIIGVTGPVFPLWENDSLSWFPEEFYWMIGCSGWKNLKTLSFSDYAWGANMSFRKDAFRNTLFKDAYTEGAQEEGKLGPVGDDVHFSYLLKKNTGKQILFSPNVKVNHKVNIYKLSSKFIRRYSYWQGYSDSMFKNGPDAQKERSTTEMGLLSRILLKLFPSILKGIFRNSELSLRKAKVTANVLFYFLLGYVSQRVPSIAKRVRNLV